MGEKKTGLINKSHKHNCLGVCLIHPQLQKKKKSFGVGGGFFSPLWFRCSSNAGFVSDEAKLSLSLFTVAVAFRILGGPKMQEGPLRIRAGRLASLLDNEGELSDPGKPLRRAAAPLC